MVAFGAFLAPLIRTVCDGISVCKYIKQLSHGWGKGRIVTSGQKSVLSHNVRDGNMAIPSLLTYLLHGAESFLRS